MIHKRAIILTWVGSLGAIILTWVGPPLELAKTGMRRPRLTPGIHLASLLVHLLSEWLLHHPKKMIAFICGDCCSQTVHKLCTICRSFPENGQTLRKTLKIALLFQKFSALRPPGGTHPTPLPPGVQDQKKNNRYPCLLIVPADLQLVRCGARAAAYKLFAAIET